MGCLLCANVSLGCAFFFGEGGSSFVVSKRKVRLRINIGFNHHCIATLVLDLKHSDCNPLKERTELQ